MSRRSAVAVCLTALLAGSATACGVPAVVSTGAEESTPVRFAGEEGGDVQVARLYVDDHESNSGDLLSMNGLRVRYSCNNPGELFVYAQVEPDSGGTMVLNTYAGGPLTVAEDGEEVEIASVAIGNTALGRLYYSDPAGRTVDVDWMIRSLDSCLFVGTAVGSG